MNKKQTERLAEWLSIMETKIQTINERTKTHTIDIKKLEKEVKKLKKSKKGLGRNYGY